MVLVNLNLGAGTNRKQDYLSVDFYTDADIKHDLTKPLPYADGTVDNIYACHVVEHFSKAEWEVIAKDWSRVIKPGGCIEIRCPDIVLSAQRLIANPKDPFNIQIIYGNQTTPGEFHKNGFTYASLTEYFPEFTSVLLEPSTDYELHIKLTKEG